MSHKKIITIAILTYILFYISLFLSNCSSTSKMNKNLYNNINERSRNSYQTYDSTQIILEYPCGDKFIIYEKENILLIFNYDSVLSKIDNQINSVKYRCVKKHLLKTRKYITQNIGEKNNLLIEFNQSNPIKVRLEFIFSELLDKGNLIVFDKKIGDMPKQILSYHFREDSYFDDKLLSSWSGKIYSLNRDKELLMIVEWHASGF